MFFAFLKRPAPKNQSLKITVTGSESSGKSELIKQFITTACPSNHADATGNNYSATYKDTDLKIHESNGDIENTQLENTDAILIVYDISDINSLQAAKAQLDATLTLLDSIDGTKLVCIVPNKSDKQFNKKLQNNELGNLMVKHSEKGHIVIFNPGISAQTGERVPNLFEKVIKYSKKCGILEADSTANNSARLQARGINVPILTCENKPIYILRSSQK